MSARPRLCIVVHSHYPVGEPRVERQALAASDAGYDVTVFALGAAAEHRREIVDGVRVHRLPLEHRRGVSFVATMWEYVCFAVFATVAVARLHLRNPFDVVQVATPPDFLAVAGLLPKLTGSRLVVDIHDLSPHMFVARFGNRSLRRAVSAILICVERLACTVSDSVITVHEPYRRELVRHGIPEGSICVVFNSVDERLLKRVRSTLPGGASERPFTIAYHGTINRWYGVGLVVEALAELMPAIDARAVVLGDGDSLRDVEARAQELGVADRIEFSRRYLPIDDVLRRVASSADCGVIPNLPTTLNRFALSSKLFEYVSLGIPVVVAELETLREHFSGDEVTFFEAGSSQSLARALAWVHDNPDESRAKAGCALERGREYSWARSSRSYIALLDAPGATALI